MKKILLVSASESFRERNTHLLERSYFLITSAASGKDALLLYQKDPVDIVVSELLLNDMGGDELCTLIRQSCSQDDFSFILVCHDIPAEIERAIKSTANYYITKPVQPVQLLKAVGDFASAKMLRSKRVPIQVRVTAGIEKREFYCTSHDISLTGILIKTAEQLKLGDQIICHFSLPGLGSIETEGEIMRDKRELDGEHMYGVQFSGLKREYRHKIDQFIASISHDKSHA